MTHARHTMADAFSILSHSGTPLIARLAVKFAVLVATWATRRQTRRALTRLEPWQLRDVGLTPAQALDESRRVFWRV